MRSKDALVYAGGLLLQQVVTFFSAVLVARWLGASDYGILSLTRNVFAIALILAPLGLDLSLLKYLVQFEKQNTGQANAHVSILRMLVFLMNVIFVVFVVFVVGIFLEKNIYNYPDFSKYLALTFLSLPVAADIALLTAVFRSRGKPLVQSVVALYIQPLVRVGALAIALWSGWGLSGVILSTFIGYVSASSILWIIYWRWIRVEAKYSQCDAKDYRSIASLMRMSSWMALSVLVYSVLRNMDILVLGRFESAAVVGQYSALSAIAQLIQIFPQAFSQTLGPSVARKHQAHDTDGMRQEIASYLRVACLLAGPIAACIAMFGPWFDLLVGSSFHFDTRVSVVLAIGYFVSAVLAPMGYSLSMTGYHRQEFAVLLLGTLLTAIFCWVGGKFYGAVGVATAILIGFLSINAARGFLVYKIHKFIFYENKLLSPLILAAFVTVLARILSDNFLPRTLFSCSVVVIVSCLSIFFLFWCFLFSINEKEAFLKKIHLIK